MDALKLAEYALLGLQLANTILEKGGPEYIKWKDGTELRNPTAEDFEKLKVQRMADMEV